MAQRASRKVRVWSRVGEKGGLWDEWATTLLSLYKNMHVRRVLCGLPAFFFAATLAHGRVIGGGSPFAPAFLCAAWGLERQGLPAALGCVFGTLLAGDAAGLLTCVLLTLTFYLLRFFRVRPNTLLCLLLCGVFQLVLPLIWAENLYDVLMASFSALSGVLLVPLFAGGLSVELGKRKYLCPEEKFGLLLLAAAALSGLRDLRFFGVSPVLSALAFLCAAAGFFGGAGTGALCGTICGLLCAVTLPSDPSLLPVYPMLGLLCGLPVTKNRLWVLPAALLTTLLSVSFNKTLLMLTHGIELAAAIAGVLFLNVRQRERITSYLNRESVSAAVPDRVSQAADRLRTFAGLYRRMAKAGGVGAGQLAAVGQALCNAAKELETPETPCPDLENCVREVLEQAGVFAESVEVLRKEQKIQAKITVLCGQKDGLCARELPRLVSRALSRPMRLTPLGICPVHGGCALLFSEEPLYRCMVGVASRSAGKVSGDTFSSSELPCDRLLLALSDGMGHGEEANAESRAAMELIETYLSAGFAPEDALPAVNDALLQNIAAEHFATMDVALLDRHSLCTQVLKVGSCPSYVRRGRELIVLSGEGLPLGILRSVKPSVTNLSLQDGDTLFLLTDGVCDALSGNEEALQKLLCALPLRDPETMAETLLSAVCEAGEPKDDMTAAVVRVSRR